MKGRIWFPGNPWPKGHAIKRAVWSGGVDADRGLVFDLDVATADYDAEGDGRDTGEEASWKAPGVWTNYNACSLSSTKWGHRGIVVGTAKKKLAWSKLDGTTLRANRVKELSAEMLEGNDDLAFGIYLMGHDAVADHAIRFARTGTTYTIDWKAKIALAYVGSYDLRYRMRTEISGLTFGGFKLEDGLTAKQGRALFDAAVVDPGAWTLRGRTFVRGAKKR